MAHSNERTILLSEEIPARAIQDKVLSRTNSVRVILVRSEIAYTWDKVGTDIEVIVDRSLYSPLSSECVNLHGSYLDIYRTVASNPHAFYIAEKHGHGAFNNAVRIANICWRLLALFDRIQPTRMVCVSTPHTLADWVAASIAQQLDIPIYIVAQSPVPWKAWCVSGVEEQAPLDLDQLRGVRSGGHSTAKSPSSELKKYVEVNAGHDYMAAMPTIERLAQELPSSVTGGMTNHLFIEPPTKSRERNPIPLAKKYLWHKKLRRYQARLLDLYNRLCEPIPTGPIVTLFLHYQPERTTMPEGSIFANQLAATFSLVKRLPAGWRLVVREHPAIFRGPGAFRPAFRDGYFYRALSSIPNVSLAPLDVEPFELIDLSELVVTVTGTVGVQSLCRGVPVLALGAASYRGAPGVHHVPLGEMEQDLAISTCFKQISSSPSQLNQSSLLSYLAWVESNSVGEFGVESDNFGSSVFAPTLDARLEALSVLVS